jgi:hypothetical protein
MIKLTNALNRQTEHALSVLHARDQLLNASGGSLTVEVGDAAGSCSDVHMQVEPSNGSQPTQACNAGESTPADGVSMNAVSEGVTIEDAVPKNALPEKASSNNVAPENAVHTNDSQRVANAEVEKVEPAKATARVSSPEPG